MLPSCTAEEKTTLAGLEAEGLAGTKTDAQILSALADIMVSQLGQMVPKWDILFETDYS